jgi:5-methylcytosine-specific restriction endonuclease McrA
MAEHPTRDTYVTANDRPSCAVCAVCGTSLHGRADQRYCTPACRQSAYRARTSTATLQPQLTPTGRSRRDHTVYECAYCGQRLAGEQWCPECQRPARRIGPGGFCPSCGDPITIADLTEAPMA